jgi:hypothetical protein
LRGLIIVTVVVSGVRADPGDIADSTEPAATYTRDSAESPADTGDPGDAATLADPSWEAASDAADVSKPVSTTTDNIADAATN